MDRKEIQKQRMMAYFINAAKEIITEEGVKGLTARKVGEKAGFSYATLYNYFNDIKELLAYCAFDFLEDCYKYMLGFKDDSKDSLQQLIAHSCAYFRYFAENPDLFRLVFTEDIGDIYKTLGKENKRPSVDLLLEDTLVRCARDGYISEKKVDLVGELIASSLHGKLVFYVGGRSSMSLDEMIKLIEADVRFLMEDKNEKE
ncbi:MAG TPA: TetR/AcrR family transcriptional regulator [Clostridiaceae bacterium]|nr:TetR/AcrR family transcriptional regulator [Clostridiaceae bacterium]